MQATGNPLAVRCSAQPKCQEATKLVRRRKFGSVATALLGTLGVVCVASGAGPGRIHAVGSIATDPNRYSKLTFTILPCVPTNQPACGLANATAQ